MDSALIVGLVASVFGGSLVSLITYLGGRDRNRAETKKLLAEAERTHAEAERTQVETITLLSSRDTVERVSDNTTRRFGDVVTPWIIRGSRPNDYNVTLDRTVAHSGSASARLEAQPGARGFVTLMQRVRSTSMLGKKMRMSGYVKAQKVEHAALWMRVDGAEDETIRFDNMENRPIVGTTEWEQYHIVLEVPESSTHVAFGIILAGPGLVWVDDFSFEPVDDTVESTDMIGDTPLPRTPEDLGFEL